MKGVNGTATFVKERAIGIFDPSAGRLELLSRWFQAEYSGLLRFAYFVCRDRAAAEDLVHDAFVRLYRADRHIAEEGFRAYARRTIVNLNQSGFRRRTRELRAASRIDPAHTAHSATEERDEVWSAMADLSPQQRACVALRFYEDLKEDEIAAVLGVSAGTVKKQMSRAMERMRRTLGDRSEP